MPRGVKGSGQPRVKKSIDDRLAEVEAVIEGLQEKLSEAKAKRKDLMQIKEKNEFDTIQKLIQESGMTAEQIKALISTNSPE